MSLFRKPKSALDTPEAELLARYRNEAYEADAAALIEMYARAALSADRLRAALQRCNQAMRAANENHD